MITQKELQEFLDYNPDTGIFIWKKKSGSRVNLGGVAGTLAVKSGYWTIGFRGIRYYAHKLAWLYVYGEWLEWPRQQIDHRDRNRTNNAIKNLRKATSEQQKGNCIRKPGKSGAIGVYASGNRWVAAISHGNVSHYLGLFTTVEEASAVRERAAKNKWHEFYLRQRRIRERGA